MRRLPHSVMDVSLLAQEATSTNQIVYSRRALLRTSLLSVVFGGLGIASRWSVATEPTGDTSYHAKEEAERAIPFDNLKPETRAKLLAIVDRPTLYRRLPTQSVACDHDLHLFLTRYPEVVVNIWRLMGITNMRATRVGEFAVSGDDGAGTKSRIDLVYGTPELHLFYCEGEYEGPLFKRKTTGRSVLLLRSKFGMDRHKRPVVTDHLDVFLQVDGVGLDLVTKTLHTTVGKTIDSNFIETTKFIGRISDSAERNGPGMQNLAEKLEECEEPIRTEFASVCANTTNRAAERMAQLVAPIQVDGNGRVYQPASAIKPSNLRR
jgi:hypothetical protein